MENYKWIYDIFAFIGMLVCIIIALIAIVWVTCFAVKLLIKTFGVRVGKSYDIMVEDINKKSEAKKERKEISRKAAFDKKMEILNMKLENKQKIHEMKKQKLEQKLARQEENAKLRFFGDNKQEELEFIEPEVEHEIIKVYEDVETKKEIETKNKTRKTSKKK